MSEQAQDEESKRLKQLEEARKRVEELKKKKKNKKNKNKKNNQTDQDSRPSDNTKDEEPTSSQETVNDPTQQDEEPTSSQETANDLTQQDEDLNKEKSEVHLNQELPNEILNENVSITEDEAGTHVKAGDTKDVKEAEDAVTDSKRMTNTLSAPKSGSDNGKPDSQNDTKDLFGDDNSADFMTTIQNEQEKTEIEDLKNQIETLLKENKTLKFINMDHETEVEELQNEIESLTKELSATQNELTITKQQLEQKESEHIVGAQEQQQQQQQQHCDFDTFRSSNFANEYATNALVENVDRAKLDKWRNWNVDMTTWRSIGSGAIVEF